MPLNLKSIHRLITIPSWWHLVVVPLVAGLAATWLLAPDFRAEVALNKPPEPAGRFAAALVQAEGAGCQVESGEFFKLIIRREDASSALRAMEAVLRSLRAAAVRDADNLVKTSLAEAEAFSRLAGKADGAGSPPDTDALKSATARMDLARRNAEAMFAWSMNLTATEVTVTDRALKGPRAGMAVVLSLVVSSFLLFSAGGSPRRRPD